MITRQPAITSLPHTLGDMFFRVSISHHKTRWLEHSIELFISKKVTGRPIFTYIFHFEKKKTNVWPDLVILMTYLFVYSFEKKTPHNTVDKQLG